MLPNACGCAIVDPGDVFFGDVIADTGPTPVIFLGRRHPELRAEP